jgi:hypothetical protein
MLKRQSLAPAFLFVALTCFYLIFLNADEESLQVANFLGPIGLGLVCIVCVVRSISRDKVAILYPLTSALLASAFYFGFGPLLYYFGTEESLDYSQRQFLMDQRFLLLTNLMNAAFLFLVYTGHAITLRIKKLSTNIRKHERNESKTKIDAALLIVFCLIVGGFAKYCILNGKFITFASLFSHLSILLDICLAPMAYLAARGKSFARFFFVVLFSIMFLLSLIMFSKTAMMRSAVMALTGLILGGTRMRWIALFSIIVFAQFVLFATPVSNLRGERNKVFGNNDSTLYDHAVLLSNMFDEGRLFENESNQTTWFLRFNCAPTQAFAIHQYNTGRTGDSYKHILWVFVPRILFPDKPSMTEIGVEYSTEFNGNSSNSVSIGIAGEAYHNGGFLTFFIVGLLLGVEFAVLERFASSLFDSVWLYFPCLILIVLMGTRVDGHLVPDYIGTPLIIGAFYVLGRTLSMLSNSMGFGHEQEQISGGFS